MSMSKRQEIKEQRLRRKRQERLTALMVISGIVLVVIAIVIAPSVVQAVRPVGEITPVTPLQRPLVDGRAMGDPNAPVVVEVFEDFQCPACRNYSNTTEKSLVQSGYLEDGLVYYIFRQYPFIDDFASGNESDQAANASMCAAEQGLFWEYHDMLYLNWNGENQGAFSDKRLIAFAEMLGLDMAAFKACFEENRYWPQIQEDLDLGKQRNVTGTPTVFVNGKVVTPGYVPSYEQLKQAIDAALGR